MEKVKTHRTQLTVGGNIIKFPGYVTTPTVDLTTVKLIFNSGLSTQNAKSMCAEIFNFYFNNTIERYEYMKLTLDIIPYKTNKKYKLQDLAHKLFVYMKIQKCMYVLLQSVNITNNKMKQYLDIFGNDPEPITPGLWWHQTNLLQFSLGVYDFSV